MNQEKEELLPSNKTFKAVNTSGMPYPGVFYRIRKRFGKEGVEKVYFVTFKRNNKKIETKVGRQYSDKMTPAKAANIRSDLIQGKRKTRKEAREDAKKEKLLQDSIYTINRLWKTYVKQREESLNLKKDENRYIKYLKPYFAEKQVADIIPLDVDRIRLKYSKTLSAQTVKHILALLKRIINFGVKKELCSPLSFVIEMPQVNNIKDDALSPDQLSSLFKAIEKDRHPHAGSIMLIALYTGMRRGSIFNLKHDDINFERGFIRLRDPKSGKDDTIPLNDQARRVFKNHIRTKSDYVFPGRGGKKRTNAQKSINAIKEAAGIPKHIRPLHSLRHTFATLAAEDDNIDIFTLQKLTTHRTISQLQRYVGVTDKRKKQASSSVGLAVENAMKSKKKKQIKKA